LETTAEEGKVERFSAAVRKLLKEKLAEYEAKV
jgi:hypothetical protein